MRQSSTIDLSRIEQRIVHRSASLGIVLAISWILEQTYCESRCISNLVDSFYDHVTTNETSILGPKSFSESSMIILPRRYDVIAAFNRLKEGLKLTKSEKIIFLKGT